MQKIAAEILQFAKDIFDIQIQENPFAIRPDNKYLVINSDINKTPEGEERISYPARIDTEDYLKYLEYKFDAGNVIGTIKRIPKSEDVNDYQVNVAVEYEKDYWFADIRISATSEGYRIMGKPYSSGTIEDLTETYQDEIESHLEIIRDKLKFMRFMLYDIKPRDPLSDGSNYLNMFAPDNPTIEIPYSESVKAITTNREVNNSINPSSSIRYPKDYEQKLSRVLQLDQFNYDNFINQIISELKKEIDDLKSVNSVVRSNRNNTRIKQIEYILNTPELLKYYVNRRLLINIKNCLESILGIKEVSSLAGTGTFFGLDGKKRTVSGDDLRLLVFCDIERVRKVLYKKAKLEFTHIKKILNRKNSDKRTELLTNNGYVIDNRGRKRLLPKISDDYSRLQELLGISTFDYNSFCELKRAELDLRITKNY